MNNYKPKYMGTHSVKYTLQYGEFKGFFITKVGGNCKGSSLLKSHIIEDINNDEISETDCDFRYNEESDGFDFTLHYGEEKIEFEDWDERDVANMLVAIEIIDYTPEEK